MASLKVDRDKQIERDTSFLQQPLDGNLCHRMVEQSSIYTHKPFLENTDSKPDDDTESINI